MKTSSLFFDSKIESDSTDIRRTIIDSLPRYDANFYTKDWVCNQFYQSVYASSRTKSKYKSDDVFWFVDKCVTDDHYLAPRLVIRALLENERDILYDEKEFLKIYTICTKTVKVTKKQNNIVKFKKYNDDVIVSELTVDKYDKFAPWWNDECVDFGEFPLKKTVPKFLTKFEKSRLKKY